MKKVLMMAVGLVSLLQASEGASAAAASGAAAPAGGGAGVGRTNNESNYAEIAPAYAPVGRSIDERLAEAHRNVGRRQSFADLKSLRNSEVLPDPVRAGQSTEIMIGLYRDAVRENSRLEHLFYENNLGAKLRGIYGEGARSFTRKTGAGIRVESGRFVFFSDIAKSDYKEVFEALSTLNGECTSSYEMRLFKQPEIG